MVKAWKSIEIVIIPYFDLLWCNKFEAHKGLTNQSDFGETKEKHEHYLKR
jgi:hypothetical protein